MNTYCVRNGQIEVGVIEHEGHEFSALGATVQRRHLTAYTRRINGQIVLTTWCGQVILACRSEVVERFWSDAFAILFRLTKGRFVVGYCLGDEGMLFRGELLSDCTDEEARRSAIQISETFAELDAEDESADWGE
ncbi:MAG TPA: hypothetical protein VHC22_13410 [Pirellulales bacterium]|nr:hypothetical protein [Pirellulales bacterium]